MLTATTGSYVHYHKVSQCLLSMQQLAMTKAGLINKVTQAEESAPGTPEVLLHDVDLNTRLKQASCKKIETNGCQKR